MKAHGEEKTIAAWARDGRCQVNAQTLRRRLLKGMTPELALSTPPRGPGRPATGATTMKVSAQLPIELVEWMDEQPGSRGGQIREAMEAKRQSCLIATAYFGTEC